MLCRPTALFCRTVLPHCSALPLASALFYHIRSLRERGHGYLTVTVCCRQRRRRARAAPLFKKL
ncbi:hypothetical protein [Methanimicrococcus blatticola]|uniref:hypothetical protein n=1 Tax=Methanimicrococcus blatticola TaxID=91560 RepID=UPI00105F166D|nr:hypothetical protein [Methanimicrococcus blatticola]MBZ3936086.1 hypothetical protein [Methanimicrococcus blatticola]MCC2509305.1 hypothetical protein [Methanimicrococcus blatticola]